MGAPLHSGAPTEVLKGTMQKLLDMFDRLTGLLTEKIDDFKTERLAIIRAKLRVETRGRVFAGLMVSNSYREVQ